MRYSIQTVTQSLLTVHGRQEVCGGPWLVVERTFSTTGSQLLKHLEHADRTHRWYRDWGDYWHMHAPVGVLGRIQQASRPTTLVLFRVRTDGTVHVRHGSRVRGIYPVDSKTCQCLWCGSAGRRVQLERAGCPNCAVDEADELRHWLKERGGAL